MRPGATGIQVGMMLDPGGEGGRQGVALAGPGGDADVLGAHPRREFFRAAEAVQLVVDGVAVAAEKRGREGHADLVPAGERAQIFGLAL